VLVALVLVLVVVVVVVVVVVGDVVVVPLSILMIVLINDILSMFVFYSNNSPNASSNDFNSRKHEDDVLPT